MTTREHQNRRISMGAQRLARLAHLNAPSVILLQSVDNLVRHIEALCHEAGTDPAEWRASLAEIKAAPPEPMTPEEIAEMEAEDRTYAAADEAARKASGYIEVEWERLDSSYRFDLVMQHYPEETTP
jgi:hypothetical protein